MRGLTRHPALSSKSRLLRILARLYPQPASELVFANEYQLLSCVVLSAQCTDKKVNQVTPELFLRYPTFEALAGAQLADVEAIVRPINYYRTKAGNLIALSSQVCCEFGGKVPRTHAQLTSLPGVGNKTANVVLSELGAARTFPVDTHVFRVSRRLGLARGNTVAKVEEELKAQFASRHWRNLHHRLILHGRRTCKAPRPLCEACALTRMCRYSRSGTNRSSAR